MASTSLYFIVRLAGVFLLGAAISNANNTCCPTGWLGYNGHCYRYFTTNGNFDHARYFCQNQGGDVVSIHSDLENEIVKTISHGEEIWIGLNDMRAESTYEWSDSTAVTYTKWNSGEPNDHGRGQDCVGMSWHNYPAGTWHDYWCSGHNTFNVVCKK